MSASSWDRAVEAAATIEAERHQVDIKRGGCTCGFCAWSADHVAIYAVRAAIPVLLEELAQRIEGGADGLVRTARQAVEDGDKGLARYASIRAEGVRCALGTVRGFAAELTKKAGP